MPFDPDQRSITTPTAFPSTGYIGHLFETHARDLVRCLSGNISAARDFVEIAIGAFVSNGHVDDDGASCDKQWLHQKFSCELKYVLEPFIPPWDCIAFVPSSRPSTQQTASELYSIYSIPFLWCICHSFSFSYYRLHTPALRFRRRLVILANLSAVPVTWLPTKRGYS